MKSKKLKNKRDTIAVVQPAVPHYRVDFFNKLARFKAFRVYAVKKDFLDVGSVPDLNYVSYQDAFLNIGPFYWHVNLPLFEILMNYKKIVFNGNMRILNYMILLCLGKCLGREMIWWGHLDSAGGKRISSIIRHRLMRFASKRLFYTDAELFSYKWKKNSFSLNNGLQKPENVRKKTLDDFQRTEVLRLFFVGRLTHKSKLLFALSALQESSINFEFHIIGAGPLIASCECYIRDPRYKFYGEILDKDRIMSIAQDCELFIYPGAVGLSVIQAFGFGLPAIVHATKIEHMPEFAAVSNGHNAVLFENENKNDFITKLKEYTNLDSFEKLRMHLSALETVNTTYNTDDMVLRMLRCLEG